MNERGSLAELARLFGKLGVVAFGGPAAHIAMMEDEVVTRRGWMERQHFLDLIGATNLIPGPNSTEMTMHVGYERAGWRGLVTAGGSFILPAVLITGIFAWLYVRFGTLPEVEPFLFGIKPVVIAVILGAVWRLGKTAVKGVRYAVIGAAVMLAVLQGVNEVVALLAGGVIGMAWLRLRGVVTGLLLAPVLTRALLWPRRAWAALGAGIGSTVAAQATSAAGSVSLLKLGLFFLKVGAILYGSGYVLVAFLEGDLVQGYGWLTEQQLLDAIAIGQFTPGPVLSTSTFIGYVIAGPVGAVVATVAIFLPSFFFVLVLNPWIPRLRESPWTAAFLDAVNVSAVGLMAAVTLELGVSTLVTLPAWIIAAVAGVLAIGFRVNAAWLVVGGAVAGWLFGFL